MFDIEASGTVEIFNLAKKLESEGKKFIHLEVGELDFNTPKYIVDAAVNALKQNITKYTETKGIPSLRSEIATYMKNRYKIKEINHDKNIMVTPGAKFGLFASLLSYLAPGDEIVVFSPSYPTFRAIPNAMKIKVREIPILRGSEIIPVDEILEDLKSKINENTRFFILNGPANPTGQVIYSSTLKGVWEICRKFDRIWFLVDDIYEQFIYPPATFESTSKFDPMLEKTIIVNGFSKSFCMTGFRLGYVVSNESVIEKLLKFQQNSVTCATSFVQKSGEIALKSFNENWKEYKQFKTEMMKDLINRREFLYNGLNKIHGIKCNKPEGAFYIFPDISELDVDSHKFSMSLIKKGVVTTPGVFFGQGGEGHIRICYTHPEKQLKQALDIMEKFSSEITSKNKY